MAADQTTLALGIDSSASVTGAQQHVRAAGDIKTANLAMGASFDTVTAATQRLTEQQALIENAYKGAIGASDMASDAARRATLATDQERAEFDTLVGSANAAALAHQRLTESMGATTAAATTTASAVAAIEPATSNSFGGVTRLVRSFDSMAFAAAGVRGPLVSVTSSLGLLGLGSTLMLAVSAGAVAIAVAYELLSKDAKDAAAANDALTASLKKQQDAEDAAGRTALLTAKNDAQAKLNRALVVQTSQGAEASHSGIADLIIQDRLALSAASVQLEKYDADQRHANDTDKLTLEILQQKAAAHVLDAAGWAQLTDIRQKATAELADATAKEATATVGSIAYTAAQKEEKDARATLATINGLYTKSTDEVVSATERARMSAANLAIQLDKNAAESLKASGDSIGATQADLAAELLKIDSTAAHTIAISKLTGQRLLDLTATENATAATERATATDRANATIATEIAAQKKLFADADARYADAAETSIKLQAQLAGDSKTAFAAKYDLQIQKIQQATDKTIAATEADKNLTEVDKFWLEAEAFVTGAIAINNVKVQEGIDLKKQAADGTAAVASAEATYYGALLKSLGFTTAAHDLETAARMRAIAATLQQEVIAHKITQDKADEAMGYLRAAAALDEQTGKVVSATNKQADAFRQLGHDIEHALATSLDNVFTKGLASFADFITQVESLFAKMLADLVAQALTANIMGAAAKGAGTTAGGVSVNLPLSQIANADTLAPGNGLLGAISPQTAILAVGVAIAGAVKSMFDAAAAAKLAAEKLAVAEVAWATTLQAYVDSTSSAVSDFQKVLDAAASGLQSLKDAAASKFGIDPTWAAGVERATAEQLAGLQQQLTAGRAAMVGMGIPTATIDSELAFIKALQQIPGAADAAAEAIKTFTTTIQDAYTASLPGGANRNTLAGFETTRLGVANSIAAAEAPGGGMTVAEANRLLALNEQTFVNNVDNLLKGLNQADLETLIPTLTGDTLAYATALDAVLKKTQEATILAANATAQGGLYGRMAAATATSDPTASTAYAAQARHQQQQDEIAAATKKRDDDLAAHASDAAIAADNLTIKMIGVTQGMENAATAAAVAAAAVAAYATAQTGFNAIVLQGAQLSGDAEQIRYANLAITRDNLNTQFNALGAQYAAGTISVEQYNRGLKITNDEWNSAMASFDGTVGGVTQAVHDLAVAAQILANNASQLTQQFSVFGTTLEDQATIVRKLYGFSGMSDDAIRAQYVKEKNGTDLTPAQKTLDDNIAAYFAIESRYLASIATSTATTATAAAPNLAGAVSATYGPSTSILGPGATFYISIQIDPSMAENGPAIMQKVKEAIQSQLPTIDRQQFNRASLVKTMAGGGGSRT